MATNWRGNTFTSLTVTGVSSFANGTVGAPSLTFTSNPVSGLYLIGANNIGVAVNGAKVLDVLTTGLAVTGTLSATVTNGTLAINDSGNLALSASATDNCFVSFANSVDGGTQGYVGEARALFGGGAGNNGLVGLRGESGIVFGVGASEKARIDASGNLGLGTATFGTNAVGVLAVKNGTAPTTGPADAVQFYSSDDAAGHTIPSFFCEGTNVLATGQADSASSVRVKVRINGTVVTLLAI